MNTVLVTGGSGFIGTWVLRELLETGARVVSLDVRPATERWNRVLGVRAKDVAFSDVSLTDRDRLAALMKQHDVSHVIHLAALLTPDCQQDPFRGCQVNVLGSTAVFDAARITGRIAAISYASSYAVYGDQPQAAAEQPHAPPMFYGAFKQAVDLIAEQYWRHCGLRSIAIRPHVVYGPERELGLTAGPSLACRAAVRGEPYTIGYTGVVGYDYVEDVARAFVRGALECPTGATIVDLPSEPATTEEFVRLLTELQPASAGTITVSGPTIPRNIPSTPRLIAGVFRDWQPTPLAAGIAKTLDYYRGRAVGSGQSAVGDSQSPLPTPHSPLPTPLLTQFASRCLQRTGVPPATADEVALALATTDAMGVFTHGTKLLAGYLKKLQGGGYVATALPRIEREGPGWAIIDGQSALGQVGSLSAIRVAMQKARRVGMAYVGLRNTGHIGAAGYYAALAAREGMIAMVTGNDMPSVAAPGSRKAVLGSNPLAYAVPVPDGDPILLDIATAAVAGGKVYAAIQRGEPIPNTWLIGPDGQPTTDGSLYPQHAALAPMAGHKGYGFGLWCEILSAILPGGNMTWQVGSWIFDEPSRPSWHNASFTVIDVAAMTPLGEFQQRLRRLIDELHAAPTATGVERVLLPGEREWNNYHLAQTQGIPLPPDVQEKLRQASELTGVPLIGL